MTPDCILTGEETSEPEPSRVLQDAQKQQMLLDVLEKIGKQEKSSRASEQRVKLGWPSVIYPAGTYGWNIELRKEAKRISVSGLLADAKALVSLVDSKQAVQVDVSPPEKRRRPRPASG